MSTVAAAGAAGAARAAAERKEEEEMTPYTPKDIAEGWEFKIMRSATGAFRKPDLLRTVLDQEQRAGWTLVEKFDDARIRLKRPASARANDATLDFDPYRIWVGSRVPIVPLAIMFVAISLALAVAIYFIASRPR